MTDTPTFTRRSDFCELVSKAVAILATGAGPIHERLIGAGVFELVHAAQYAEAFPGQIQSRFDDVWSRLTSAEPAGEEGSIAASVGKLSVDEAQQIAREILEISSMADHVHDQED